MYSISKRNITVLFWVNFFGAISFLQPVLTLFYLENGLSEANILMILMCWSGAVLIGEIPAGVFADRFGPKISFLVGSTIKLISVVVLLLSHDLLLFMLFSFLNGLSVTFFSGADEALIYESLKKDNKQSKMDEAMGKIQSAGFISMILAVLLGSFVAKDLDQQQFQLLILCSLIAYLIELILLFFIHEPDVEITVSEASVNKVVEGISVIKKAPQLLLMFLNLTLVFIPTVAVFEKFDQPLMTDAGLPVYLIGPIYAVGALLAFFSSRNIAFLTKKVSRVALMYASGFLSAGGLLIAALFQDTLWLILGVILFLRWIGAIRYPIYSQLSNDVIPSHVRATTISLLSILDSIFDLIVFVSLLLFAVEGVSGILIGAAVIALLGSMIPIHNARVRRGKVAIPKEFQ
ncbi:MFS transporter [Guptibacillus algicola]|uniref:MFS transporter n=1 Tax=Guptibacillus algicola TaxID=225844 RepID=UPI001CD7B3E5|nr:MFS transporter [Alkalihalobacillus algicola]MCA0988387.1 MFS transporter [Alkalihalobacillus algicola]